MRCRAAKSLISRSFDEPIREYDRSRLEEHVQGCPDCATHVRVLERGRSLLQAATQVAPSENFEWKVQLAIQKALRQKAHESLELTPRRGFWQPLLLSTVGVASLVVVLGLLFLPLRAEAPQSQQPAEISLAADPDLRGGQPIEIYDPLYVNERGGRYASDGATANVDNPVLPWATSDGGTDALMEEVLYLRRLTLQQQEQILRLQAVRAAATLAGEPDSGAVSAPR